MWDIPSEVLSEILSRVPANTLLRFRCVSKLWKQTIDDPTFIRLHIDRQIRDSSSSGAGQLLLRGDLCSQFYFLSLDSINCDDGQIIKATSINHNPRYEGTKSPLGSCNGVMLISDSKGYNSLWNPLTREFHRLPPLKVMSKKLRGLYLSVSGLGCDCAADDYKVVKIAQVFDPRDRILNSETWVYSLKLNSWRRVRDFPYRISRLRNGVFLRGALHWISSTMPLKCTDDLIIGLDLGTDSYCVIPLPSDLFGLEKPSAKILGVLGGCLVLSCHYQIERLDLWLMKDYGVMNSWFKLFSIGAHDIGAVETLRPLAYSKFKKQVLLQHNRNEFLWFNLESKVAKKMNVHNGPATFSSQVSIESLVRLNCNRAESPSRQNQLG